MQTSVESQASQHDDAVFILTMWLLEQQKSLKLSSLAPQSPNTTYLQVTDGLTKRPFTSDPNPSTLHPLFNTQFEG